MPEGSLGVRDCLKALEWWDKRDWLPTARGKLGRDSSSEGGEVLAQVAQRSCGCSITGSVQGQLGQDLWDQAAGWNEVIFKVPCNPNL